MRARPVSELLHGPCPQGRLIKRPFKISRRRAGKSSPLARHVGRINIGA